MGSHPLRPLFDPRGVAVVGASEDPQKYGHILLRTLLEQGYPGAVHAVNPRGGEVLGRPFVRSLDETEGPIDVALVVRPAPECPGLVREAGARGIPFTIVYAAGFAEMGEAGESLQRQLVEAARASGTRVVGPNGMNVMSAPARLNLSGIVPFPEGELGFLSASGNLGYALAQEAERGGRAVGFSRFVSVGNQADLALDEYLDFLRADERTRAVLVYLEGFAPGRARAFLDALARTAAVKPVLVLRAGRTDAGQEAARSHTAALTPPSEVTRAALQQAGAVLVERADEALAIAEAFLASPLPRGRRAVLVGEGGGHATLLTDSALLSGLDLPGLPDSLVDAIRPSLPPFATLLRNPIEMGGRSELDPRVYERTLEPLFGWASCDLLVLFGGYALYDAALVSYLSRRREETGKAVLLHDLYAGEPRPCFALLRAARLPVFASGDVAVRAAAHLARGKAARERARSSLGARAVSPADLPRGLHDALERARTRRLLSLPEDEASGLLAHFGVPVLPAALASDGREAVAAAERLGFPVVLKRHDADVLHKSDDGGVRVDLRTPAEVGAAWAEMSGPAAVRLTPYRRGGVEVLVGARRDPELGPLLVFGAGGVQAEVARDVAIRTLPCDESELGSMIDETRVCGSLEGIRGGRAADRDAIVHALASLARLIQSVPRVEDVEVNPLLALPEGCVALDARVVVKP